MRLPYAPVLGLTIACLFSTSPLARAADDYSGKNLEKRDFSDKNLEGANFSDSKCSLARFVGATLTKANFQEADLTSASLDRAGLAGADFRGAVFSGTSFQGADLTGANFTGTDLKNSSFQSAKLKGASLRNCKGVGDVQKADLRDADLRGAVFTVTVYYLGGCRLTGAKYDKHTRWPQGFDLEASGAVLSEAADPPAGGKTPPADPPREDKPGERKTPDLEAAKLSDPIIKHLLETTLWGSKDGKGFTYNYKSLKMAEPRVGDFKTDGVPANRQTMVTPVRVHVEIVKDLGDNQTRSEEKQQDFVFFKDEFGSWTYRFKGNR